MAPVGEARPGTTLLVVQVELPAFNLLSHANFRVRMSDYEELHEGALDMLQAFADSFEERLVGLELEDGKLGLEKMKTRACAALEELQKEVKMVDEWKIKVDRAAKHMNKMRDAYYKELFHLREQVYQKRKADEHNTSFHPVYALHFDPADYTLEDEVAKLVQEKVQLLQQEFQTKIVDMEAKHAAKVKTLNNNIATTNILLTKKQALLKKVMTTQAPSLEGEEATAKHFRQFLCRRFGTLKEAKEYLGASRNLDEGLSIAELRSLTEELGYACREQDVKTLFRELGHGQTFVTLNAVVDGGPLPPPRRASIAGTVRRPSQQLVAINEAEEAAFSATLEAEAAAAASDDEDAASASSGVSESMASNSSLESMESATSDASKASRLSKSSRKSRSRSRPRRQGSKRAKGRLNSRKGSKRRVAAAVLTELSLDSGTAAAWADQPGSIGCFTRHRPPGNYRDQGTDALSYERAFGKTIRRSRAVQSQIDGRMLDKAMDFYDDVAEKNWNALADIMKDDPEEAPAMRAIAPALLEAFVQKSEVREIPAAERSRLCGMRATQTMSVTDLHAVEEVLASREEAVDSSRGGGDGGGSSGSGNAGGDVPSDGISSSGRVAAPRGSRLKRRVTFPPQRDRALQGRLDSLAAELTSLPTKDLGERFSSELQELATGIERVCCGSTREQAGGSSSSSAPPPDAPPDQAPNAQPSSPKGVSYCHRGTSPVQDPRELVLPNLLQAPRVPASTTEFGVQCCLASARRVIPPAEDEPHETQLEQVEHVVGVAHELHETLPAVKLRAEKLVAQAVPGSRTEQLLRQLQRVDVVLGGHPSSPSEKSGNAGVLDAQTPGMRSPASGLERNGTLQDPMSFSRRQASPGRRLSEEFGQLRRKDGRRHTSAGIPRPQSQQGNVHYYYGLVRAAPFAHREGSFTMTRNREESVGVSEGSVQEEERGEEEVGGEVEEEEQGEEEQEVEGEFISRSPKKRKSLTARRPKVVNTPQLIVDRARRRALLAKDQATELVEEGKTQADARQPERVPTVPSRQVLSEAEQEREDQGVLLKSQLEVPRALSEDFASTVPEVAPRTSVSIGSSVRFQEEHPQDGKQAAHQEEGTKGGEVEDGRRLIVHEARPLPPLDDYYVDTNIEELVVGDDLPVPRGPSPRMTGSAKTTVTEQELPDILTLAAERPGSRRHSRADSVADGKISPSASGPRRRCAPVSAKLPAQGTASSSGMVATPVSGRFQAFDFEELPSVPSRPDHSPPAQNPPARRESRTKPFRRSVEVGVEEAPPLRSGSALSRSSVRSSLTSMQVAPQEEPQSPRDSLVDRSSLRNSVGSQGSMILEEDQHPGERSWSPKLRTSTRARVTTSRAHALLARAGSMRASGREQFEP